MLTGRDLIEAGYEPAPWFGDALRQFSNLGRDDGLAAVAEMRKAAAASEAARAADLATRRIPLQDGIDFVVNVVAENQAERENLAKVLDGFADLVRTPTIEAGVVMPDTCPAGGPKEIPVGGVVAARRAIHPGMHSADICCSMFVTRLAGREPKDVLDASKGIVHFGPGGRRDGRFAPPAELLEAFAGNAFLGGEDMLRIAQTNFATSGDGNHFFYVGTDTQGESVIVTHHGSRGVGALLYKRGMTLAKAYTAEISPETAPHNAWLPSDSQVGEEYWRALQLVREWTRLSHQALHDAVADTLDAPITDRFWNEHNFVFREDDLFWHAKGATPIHAPFLPDTDGRQIIPLNMAQPILIVSGERNARNLGFAPHGAGRNLSRSGHRQTLPKGVSDEDIMRMETEGLDVRFFSPDLDVTELPSAYKDAASVRRDIERFGLCEVVEEIKPYGCVMGGEFNKNAPWKRRKLEKEKEREAQALTASDEPEDDAAAPGW